MLVQHFLDAGSRGGGNSRSSGVPVFAWKGETLEEYWDCTIKALIWPDGSGPDQIVDDGGDATLLIHKGVELENGSDWVNSESGSEEEQVIKNLLKRVQSEGNVNWANVADAMVGVSEETTTGVHRLVQMEERGELLFQAINVNDSVTKAKFDNVYGCRHSLVDGIKRALDVLISGKVAMICGYGDVGKGSAESLANERARVMVSEVDPICALQACMTGYQVTTVEDALPEADIFVTTTGNKDIITADQMSRMKDQAVVCNIGHFDNEIQVVATRGDGRCHPRSHQGRLHPRRPCDPLHLSWTAARFICSPRGGLINLGCATGHPSFVMSNSFTNQTIAQIDIRKNQDRKVGVYRLDKKLDEEVARLHLDKLGAKLTTLSQEQADYIGVPVDGPYKPEHYRY